VKGLTEFSWGVYLGKTETGETLEAMQALHAQWRAGHVDAAPPEGESPAGAFRRAWNDLAPLVTRHAHRGEDVAWVAHGRIFKIILARLVAGDVSRMEDFPQGNTAVSILEHDGKGPFDSGWALVTLNDQSHLAGLEPDTAHVGRRPLV
jgi:broad specificity phosphatase PhoE